MLKNAVLGLSAQIEAITQLIVNDRLGAAVEELRRLAEHTDFKNEANLHSSRFKYLQRISREGVITEELSQVERTRIKKALLELMDELQSESPLPSKKALKWWLLIPVLFAIGALVGFQILSQAKTEIRYYDADWAETELDSAVYKRVIEYGDGPYATVEDYFLSNGQLQFRGYMSDVEKEIFEGNCVFFLENGQKLALATCSKGKVEGQMKGWHPNGNLCLDAMLRNDEKDGIVTIYYENGNKLSTVEIENEEPTGFVYSYHENGALFRDVAVDGSYEKTYNDAGLKKMEALGGEVELVRYWYDNGQLAFELLGMTLFDYQMGNFEEHPNVVLSYLGKDGEVIIQWKVGTKKPIKVRDFPNKDGLLAAMTEVDLEILGFVTGVADKVEEMEVIATNLFQQFVDCFENKLPKDDMNGQLP